MFVVVPPEQKPMMEQWEALNSVLYVPAKYAGTKQGAGTIWNRILLQRVLFLVVPSEFARTVEVSGTIQPAPCWEPLGCDLSFCMVAYSLSTTLLQYNQVQKRTW